jgi:hypothetical protein
MRAIFMILLMVSSSQVADRAEERAIRREAKCPEWHAEAMRAGWEPQHLIRLDAVIWRESRCQPTAFNPKDPNGGSAGLSQINYFWCLPNRYSPTGWLQSQGILTNCSELFDAATNLRAARAIHRYSEERNGTGWQPWAVG